MSNNLPKIAWLSPFPPQKSGIANYSHWLVKALKRHFEIDLYYDHEPPSDELQNEFTVFPLTAFAAQRDVYRTAIYHLGNNSNFHKKIYELAWDFPGIVVLHDYNLSAFMHLAFFSDNNELYRQALPNRDGSEVRGRLQSLVQRLLPEAAKFPMSHAIVDRSRKTIVHHRWVKHQFVNNEHIAVIPHFAKLNHQPTRGAVEKYRNKVGIKDGHFVLACLGFINKNKLPELQIEVVKQLLAEGYPVQLLFAGEPAPEVEELMAEVRSGSCRENILFTGYQNESDYFNALTLADVIINLRNPSMGEASGTLMHALAAAKPTIVSDLNQYREFPDKVCWKLSHDENQAEVLCEYLRTLLSNRKVRLTLSANAAEYVNRVLSWEQIVDRWVKVILA